MTTVKDTLNLIKTEYLSIIVIHFTYIHYY